MDPEYGSIISLKFHATITGSTWYFFSPSQEITQQIGEFVARSGSEFSSTSDELLADPNSIWLDARLRGHLADFRISQFTQSRRGGFEARFGIDDLSFDRLAQSRGWAPFRVDSADLPRRRIGLGIDHRKPCELGWRSLHHASGDARRHPPRGPAKGADLCDQGALVVLRTSRHSRPPTSIRGTGRDTRLIGSILPPEPSNAQNTQFQSERRQLRSVARRFALQDLEAGWAFPRKPLRRGDEGSPRPRKAGEVRSGLPPERTTGALGLPSAPA